MYMYKECQDLLNMLSWSRSVVFSGYSVSSTDQNDSHEITEKLLKVALNTITMTMLSLI